MVKIGVTYLDEAVSKFGSLGLQVVKEYPYFVQFIFEPYRLPIYIIILYWVFSDLYYTIFCNIILDFPEKIKVICFLGRGYHENLFLAFFV